MAFHCRATRNIRRYNDKTSLRNIGWTVTYSWINDNQIQVHVVAAMLNWSFWATPLAISGQTPSQSPASFSDQTENVQKVSDLPYVLYIWRRKILLLHLVYAPIFYRNTVQYLITSPSFLLAKKQRITNASSYRFQSYNFRYSEAKDQEEFPLSVQRARNEKRTNQIRWLTMEHDDFLLIYNSQHRVGRHRGWGVLFDIFDRKY